MDVTSDDSNHSQTESLYKTRSGRVVKPVKPLYVPDLQAVEDDFDSDEIDEELAFADDDGDSIHTSSEEDEIEDDRGNIIKIGRVPSELASQQSTKRKRDADDDDDDDDESEYQPGDSSELGESLHDSDYEEDAVSDDDEDESECEPEDEVEDESEGESEDASSSQNSSQDASKDSSSDDVRCVNDVNDYGHWDNDDCVKR